MIPRFFIALPVLALGCTPAPEPAVSSVPVTPVYSATSVGSALATATATAPAAPAKPVAQFAVELPPTLAAAVRCKAGAPATAPSARIHELGFAAWKKTGRAVGIFPIAGIGGASLGPVPGGTFTTADGSALSLFAEVCDNSYQARVDLKPAQPSTATCMPATVCFPLAGGAPVAGGVIYAVALADGSPYDLLLGSAYAMEDLAFEAALGEKPLDDALAAISSSAPPLHGAKTACVTAFPQQKLETQKLGTVSGSRQTTTCGSAVASAGKAPALTADIVAVSTQGAFPNVETRPTRTAEVDRPFVNVVALRDKKTGAYVAMIRMPIR